MSSSSNWPTFGAYAQSKLANLLFTYELARRLQGTGVTANAVRPGPVATGFGSSGSGLLSLFPLIVRLIGKTAEAGARTASDLASAPPYEGASGHVFYNRNEVRTSRQAQDALLQRRLWQVSEAFTGLSDRPHTHGAPEYQERIVV